MIKRKAPLPTKEQIAEYIHEAGGDVGKRDIARAFSLSGEGRIYLKSVLRELADEGKIRKGTKRQFAHPNSLPSIMVLEIHDVDRQGDLLARPVTQADWDVAKAATGIAPRIEVEATTRIKPALGVGDRILARMEQLQVDLYRAKPTRRLSQGTARVLGVIEQAGDNFILRPTDKKASNEFLVRADDLGTAQVGDLVTAEILPKRSGRYGARQARVCERLGNRAEPKAFSLIALHANDIPYIFPSEALDQSERSKPVTELGKRTDLRDVPLVTIDGEDARDFDDAVFAEPDTAEDNPGGWHLIVAIADVAHYVQPGSPLDTVAKDRGNSVYFPDRVVPMLPENLSNNLCSLRPDEDRPCMVCHMWVDQNGRKIRHKFQRALMRSAARLTYTQVQNAIEGRTDETTAPLLDTVIKPLYAAYKALDQARVARGTLDLDIPEKKIAVDEQGNVTGVSIRERFDSHKLIEEFMIIANVAAAEALEEKRQPVMYRVHDEPTLEKLENLRTILQAVGINLAKGQVLMPRQFMQILNNAEEKPEREMIHQMVLRTQSQAMYSPDNLGHFGLALRRYAHFTSPIRRYADLLVHRALISGYGLGDDGLLSSDGTQFHEIGEQISACERRAAKAEREVVDRYAALYLQDRVGATFAGRIGGVSRFGLFVTLAETGVDGLIPISSLPNDYYIHDEAHNRLIGQRNRATFTIGDPVQVILMECNPLTGSMVLALDAGDGQPIGGRDGLRPKLGDNHRKRIGKARPDTVSKRNLKSKMAKKSKHKKASRKGSGKHTAQR